MHEIFGLIMAVVKVFELEKLP